MKWWQALDRVFYFRYLLLSLAIWLLVLWPLASHHESGGAVYAVFAVAFLLFSTIILFLNAKRRIVYLLLLPFLIIALRNGVLFSSKFSRFKMLLKQFTSSWDIFFAKFYEGLISTAHELIYLYVCVLIPFIFLLPFYLPRILKQRKNG